MQEVAITFVTFHSKLMKLHFTGLQHVGKSSSIRLIKCDNAGELTARHLCKVGSHAM